MKLFKEIVLGEVLTSTMCNQPHAWIIWWLWAAVLLIKVVKLVLLIFHLTCFLFLCLSLFYTSLCLFFVFVCPLASVGISLVRPSLLLASGAYIGSKRFLDYIFPWRSGCIPPDEKRWRENKMKIRRVVIMQLLL